MWVSQVFGLIIFFDFKFTLWMFGNLFPFGEKVLVLTDNLYDDATICATFKLYIKIHVSGTH